MTKLFDFENVRYNESTINGDMGEYLVQHQLMTYYHWDVERVDYIGADLIAVDVQSEKNQRYAISVKTRDLRWESDTFSSFKYEDKEKLLAFASDFRNSLFDEEMIGLVAIVAVLPPKKEDFDKETKTFVTERREERYMGDIYTLLLNVEDIDDLISELFDKAKEYVVKRKDNRKTWTFNLNKDTLFNYIRESKYVNYFRMPLLWKNQYEYKNKATNERVLNNEHYSKIEQDFLTSHYVWKKQLCGVRAFSVKGEGVNVIEINKSSNNSYATLVKHPDLKGYTHKDKFSRKRLFKKDELRRLRQEKGVYKITHEEIELLETFAQKWKMIPKIVLYIVVEHNDEHQVYNMEYSLREFRELSSNRRDFFYSKQRDSELKQTDYYIDMNNAGREELQSFFQEVNI